MKNSISVSIPVWVCSVPSFFKWIEQDFGISTSGLQLGWSWVYWFKYMLAYAIGHYPQWQGYVPIAFWWSGTNAENSHNERPWALWTEDSSYEV